MTDNKKEPREITLPLREYQPSKGELEKTFDMPGATTEAIRNAFFSPITIRHAKPEGE